MTVRNLDAVFAPKSVALIGASARPNSVGAVVARNLLSAGFQGPVMPVNPKHAWVMGAPCHPSVKSLPVTPELAVICTPPETVPGLIGELGARGTKGAIVITAGFRDAGSAAGLKLEQAMLDAARPHLLRIVGPNGIGVVSTASHLNASFAAGNPRAGHVAFVAQSGAVVGTVLDWAGARGIGFSHLVSLGDMADVDFGDMLDYLANDPGTHAILLYVEAITQPRKFMSAARAAARLKPVIAIKAGRSAAAAKAAASHTGALAGADDVYDAAFRRAGILRAFDLDEVFDAVETLAMRPHVGGDRLAILTNGGGVGVLATDKLMELGGRLAELDPSTIAKLNRVLPPTWSHANPVDIIGDADGKRYAAALETLFADRNIDGILVLHCPTAVASGVEAAQAVVGAIGGHKGLVLTNWLGAADADGARKLFADAGVATYDTPEKAVRGFMHLARYRRVQDQLMEVPSAAEFTPDLARARRAVAGKEGWLDPIAVQEILTAYGIPVARCALALTPNEAAGKARELGGTVALKIVSPDITHKSDVGGVVLHLAGSEAVRGAADAMLARVTEAAPSAKLDGFLIQEMVARPGACELIAGMAVDATFGPFLLFGQGGVAVERIADRALALPPLNSVLARELMMRTRVWQLLKGYRARPPADLDAIVSVLMRLSQLVCDLDEVAEIDINPLLADEKGLIAVDARMRIAPSQRAPGSRLAIKPYPQNLERRVTTEPLGDCLLRPIRPEDAPAVAQLFARLTPEDVRHRFFSPLRALPGALLARLTQIDYDREMAFVLFDGSDAIGVSRIVADPDNMRAEFAVLVRSDLKGRGIGRMLMQEIVAYARSRGIQELFGDVLEDNALMLALCRELGCAMSSVMGAQGVVRATLRLSATGIRSDTDSVLRAARQN
ncbi:MAG TPA: bifunctional acetate--CoA ligase family protein/GNAT family N-acetyltransferase [Rhizomicrobium sp.]|nr:bifunctional acetate--CoA ligase family protein/GNAT family N-acetyltransferase [Rhizomicrobium sp.]